MGPNEGESPIGGPVPLFLNNANPSARVFMVDNDLHIRMLIATYLTKAAFKVKTVADRVEAWDALQANNNSDLLITV